MPQPITKPDFLADLRHHIQQHCHTIAQRYAELDDTLLAQPPAPGEWSVLQCIDHLNLTHDYYRPRIEAALAAPKPAGRSDLYRPSFWGRIYMHFAFNPKRSFATAAEITPSPANRANRDLFAAYLARQTQLLGWLDNIGWVDVVKTAVSIERGVKFNLGDCLKILVYHDSLHLDQAERALAALQK
jgi:hypothetical protein